MRNQHAEETPEKGKDQPTQQNIQTSGTPAPCCDSSCCGGKKPVNLRITM
ncbi:MAG: hypothetical protein L0Y80_04150 [Ignavibacteriae bacterium]|nr:hypothetical protein [Ignavibacteriota bacterium]